MRCVLDITERSCKPNRKSQKGVVAYLRTPTATSPAKVNSCACVEGLVLSELHKCIG